MKHYEVLLIIHPDQSDQVTSMVERYTSQVKQGGGQVHRLEDWGRRSLAYPIQKLNKAHYVLMNIECGGGTLSELEEAIRYNDGIIRKLILKKKVAVTTESPILKGADEKREERGGRRGPGFEGRGGDARGERNRRDIDADRQDYDDNDNDNDSDSDESEEE